MIQKSFSVFNEDPIRRRLAAAAVLELIILFLCLKLKLLTTSKQIFKMEWTNCNQNSGAQPRTLLPLLGMFLNSHTLLSQSVCIISRGREAAQLLVPFLCWLLHSRASFHPSRPIFHPSMANQGGWPIRMSSTYCNAFWLQLGLANGSHQQEMEMVGVEEVEVCIPEASFLPAQEGMLCPTSHKWPFPCSYASPNLWKQSCSIKNVSKLGVLQSMMASKRETKASLDSRLRSQRLKQGCFQQCLWGPQDGFQSVK